MRLGISHNQNGRFCFFIHRTTCFRLYVGLPILKQIRFDIECWAENISASHFIGWDKMKDANGRCNGANIFNARGIS